VANTPNYSMDLRDMSSNYLYIIRLGREVVEKAGSWEFGKRNSRGGDLREKAENLETRRMQKEDGGKVKSRTFSQNRKGMSHPLSSRLR